MADRLKVKDLMSDHVLALNPEDDLATLRDIMMDNSVRHVPVVDAEHELVGLVSHRDLLRSSLIEQSSVPEFMEEALLERLKVEDVMTRDVESVTEDTAVQEAATIILENKYGCLPVVEGRRLVGILTEADFVRFFALDEA